MSKFLTNDELRNVKIICDDQNNCHIKLNGLAPLKIHIYIFVKSAFKSIYKYIVSEYIRVYQLA
jgi:hypothetical protein